MSARRSTPASLARGDEVRRDGVARVDEGRDEHEIFALLLLADVYACGVGLAAEDHRESQEDGLRRRHGA